MPYKIAIIGIETGPESSLVSSLKEEFDVSVCRLAREALELIRSQPPELAVLALELPDMPGLALLKVLRETERGRELPVILVSGHKTEGSVMEGYELGADDYLTRPLDPGELRVRIRAVLRRRYEAPVHWGGPLTVGALEIDPSQRRCLVRGRRVVLRPREFELLEILMRKAGRVLTRRYLLETVWGMAATADTRAVDVIVSRLRRRLGRAGRMIETVSKMGYMCRPASG